MQAGAGAGGIGAAWWTVNDSRAEQTNTI
ncbi:hypothetical protein SGPA1_10399 [Streptomyces misionensis JCM 4497]